MPRDAAGMAALFRQFSFPGGVPSHVAPETPGSIHEGGELGYSLSHAHGAAFDNPGPDRGLRGRRRRGGDRPAGHQLALRQVPRPGPGRRGAADPAPERLEDRQPDRAGPDPRAGTRSRCCAATATSRCIVAGARAARLCTRKWRPRWTAAIAAIRAIQQRGAVRCRRPDGQGPAAALADDRAAHARRAGPARRRWTGCRWRAPGGRTRCRWPRSGPTRRTCASSRSGCGPTGRTSCSTTTGGPAPELLGLVPGGERRLGANPHANGGLLLRDLVHARTSATTRCRSPRRARSMSEPTRVLGGMLRDVMRLQRRPRATSGCSARTRPSPTGWTRCYEVTGKTWEERDPAGRRAPGRRRPGDGDPVRAHLPGLAGGLPADRPARPVLLLRGVHPHRRLDVQPARQVAEGQPRRCPGGARSRR